MVKPNSFWNEQSLLSRTSFGKVACLLSGFTTPRTKAVALRKTCGTSKDNYPLLGEFEEKGFIVKEGNDHYQKYVLSDNGQMILEIMKKGIENDCGV